MMEFVKQARAKAAAAKVANHTDWNSKGAATLVSDGG